MMPFGLNGLLPFGMPAATPGIYTGTVLPKPPGVDDIKANADIKVIKGDRQADGEDRFIEIRGPSGIGDRSKTPYYKVLPKYKKQAEAALDKEKIPRQHQKRVKEYFDSLAGGK